MSSLPSASRSRVLFAALALILAASTPASATHLTVRPDGSGDYATMQAGVSAMTFGPFPADTLVLEPGYYDETVNFPDDFQRVIYARAGAESTTVKATTSLPERPHYVGGTGRIVGLEIESRVDWGNNMGYATWKDCIFAGGWTSSVKLPDVAPMTKLRHCTFLAATYLSRSVHDLADCTFDAAPIIASNADSYLRFLRCRFTGPASRLISVTPFSNSDIVFEQCVFENAGDAIEVAPTKYNHQYVEVRRCVFDSLTGTALKYSFGDPTVPAAGNLYLELTDSRITNVGSAVQCEVPVQLVWLMERDTIQGTSGPGIAASIRYGSIRAIDLSDAQGGGIHLRNHPHKVGIDDSAANTWSLTDCRIARTGGDGIAIDQMTEAVWDPQKITVRNTRSELNAGAGLRVTGSGPVVTGCVLRGNGGEGLHAIVDHAAAACSLANNTAVQNLGAGIVVEPDASLPTAVHHNLSTHNVGTGIAMLAAYTGVASFNDAWLNGGTPYLGLTGGETNLELDPLYCMLSAGDFELRADSPCAPSGIYGPVGALGVGCVVPTAVSHASIGDGGLRLAPNPARGAVSFGWDLGVSLDALTIYDVQGRTRWSASESSLRSGVLRWDGRGPAGERLPAGVYLVRWRQGGREGARRLVLLGD